MARCSWNGRTVLVIVAAILVASGLGGRLESAAAAERCVLIEDFTATWCEPCHIAGDWLSQMLDANPNSIVLLQEHVSSTDAYAIAWGKNRFKNYPNTAEIPSVYYDGVVRIIGADPNASGRDYSAYLNAYLARQTVPTDVTVELGAEPVGGPNGPTFNVKARVGLAASGTPKTVWVYIARALDHYPVGFTYNRNCLMETAATEVLNLVPGQRQTVERAMTFDAVSLTDPHDIRVLAWAQVPGDTGYREVYQAKQIAWPLPPLYPVGDVNCDGYLSFADINPFVLAIQSESAYEAMFPNCDWLNADCNGDGMVSFADINAFVALLAQP